METRILIINSDNIEVRHLREILTREGYMIMTAIDYETARQLSTQIDFELIICEFSLMENLKPFRETSK